MRTIVSTSLSLAACFCFAAAQAQAASHHHGAAVKIAHVRLAPADEYFGRQKMSILEIGNRLRDLAVRAHYRTSDVADMMNTAAMTEDAMRDWQHKYPADPWIKKDRSALDRFYASLRE
ncbi:MAG: hypothetical protein JO104_10140 [Candidatus Eremiobacteraeota bacterium]|nr:hypothetical protein [Candidatus Eremiobacteraeota bacterium]